MKRIKKRKLEIHTETIRTLSLRRHVVGGRVYSDVPCFPGDSEVAGGCTVTDNGCDSGFRCGGTVSWLLSCGVC